MQKILPFFICKKFLYSLFTSFTFYFLYLFFYSPKVYRQILKEDQVVEWGTFSCLVLSFFILLSCACLLYRKLRIFHWFFFIFGLSCLFFALEEISWGQRVFGIESPDYFMQHSDQQETNFHNVFQKVSNLKTKHIAGIVLFIYGGVLPLFRRFRLLSSFQNTIKVMIPPIELVPCFFLSSVLMFDRPTGMEEEIGEFLFSVCFLYYALYERQRFTISGRESTIKFLQKAS